MEERPKIKLSLSEGERRIEIASLVLLLLLWTMAIVTLPHLPQQIPTHFDFSGKPNEFGDRHTVFLFPGLATIIYFLLTILCRVPQKFNYVVTITPKNAEKQYRISVRMLRILKLNLEIIFLLAVGLTFLATKTDAQKAVIAFLVIAVLLLLVPMVIGIRRMFLSSTERKN